MPDTSTGSDAASPSRFSSPLKAVLFDTFGTVVDWRSGIARAAAPFIARHGLAITPEALADDWRNRYQPAMEAVRSGRRAYVPLDVLHRENLAGLLADLAPSRQCPDDELDDLNKAWHRLDPWPDAIAGLSRLKRDYIIGPLSNGNIALLVNMARRAGLPWDVILGADVSRAYKPDSASYTETAAVLGLAPSECMLVAAHNSDLTAARSAGFATGFVPRPTEHGPRQTIDLTPEQQWDVVASDFEQLAERLGC
jgi:2-haloacid dehalogenase